MTDDILARVYGAASAEEQRAAYDDWSARYEADLAAMGYRLPSVAAALFVRHVSAEAGPILDAGCGGGLQAELLSLLGYGPLTGVDLSDGMLSVAKAKGVYADLRQMALGGRLGLPDGAFAALISTGCLTPGHAPPESLDDFPRLVRAGGRCVFSLRADNGHDAAYLDVCARMEGQGRWRPLARSPVFQTFAHGEPEVRSQVHVYEPT